MTEDAKSGESKSATSLVLFLSGESRRKLATLATGSGEKSLFYENNLKFSTSVNSIDTGL